MSEREDEALDAILALCLGTGLGGFSDEELIALDDPSILSDEDLKALEALGNDLVDRLIAKKEAVS